MMRHNQTLDAEGLRLAAVAAAQAAAESEGLTRKALAERLGVSAGAVTRALSAKEPPGWYSGLQRRIVEALTGYAVEDVTELAFRVRRKAN